MDGMAGKEDLEGGQRYQGVGRRSNVDQIPDAGGALRVSMLFIPHGLGLIHR